MAVMIDQSGPNPVVVSGAEKAISIRSLLKKQKVTLADIPDSKGRYAVPRIDQSGLPVINLSSSQYGALTVSQLIATQLSALSASTGTLIINKGGSVSSGETAYAVGSGFWLGTDASGNPQFSIQDTEGNFINIAASGTNVLAISSSGLINALTSKQIDDLGWKNTAVWLDLTGVPSTLSGYGITDAQSTLPNAAGVGQILQRDNSGAPYFSTKYDGFLNSGAMTQSGTQNFTTNVAVLLGDILDMGEPPAGANILFQLHALLQGSGGTPNATINLQYSTNSGSTWTTADSDVYTTAAVGVDITFKGFITNLNPTGNLQVRVMVTNSSGANTVQVRDTMLWCLVLPNANYTVIAGALTSSIPSTGSGNCIATYPASTCTASLNVKVTPSGGVPPYTYLWSVVSGTGTITAGSTSQTCTVSDTETATFAGATHNTTIDCKVTDSASSNATSGNDVITNTFTLVYSPITATVSTTNGSCNTNLCSTNCQAQGSATANPSGGNGSYTFSWSVVSGPGSITGGSTSQTCIVSETHGTGPGPHIDNTTVKCSVNDTRGTGAVTPQGTVSLTFSCPQH